MRNLFLIITLLLIGSCRSNTSAQQRIEEIARQQFADYELLFNESRSFVVVIEKNSTNAFARLNYLIFKCADGSQISKGSFRPGYLKWLNDDEIEIFDAPGMIREDENLDLYKKIISVRTPKY